ncbi:MAG: 30S ribosomal protein S12 methylthiotransferase RimO, partial [Muribaculaceae bacterium]|nr:30S ribosomal protein S12 methylthiotransferase RimO [Muribaculaceae bacterium]
MKKNRIDIVTLGCSRNLVDSERLMKRFSDLGYEVAHDSHNVCGEIVVINTCILYTSDAADDLIGVDL